MEWCKPTSAIDIPVIPRDDPLMARFIVVAPSIRKQWYEFEVSLPTIGGPRGAQLSDTRTNVVRRLANRRNRDIIIEQQRERSRRQREMRQRQNPPQHPEE